MLIDTATIFVRSGKGGDGVVSFHREKYVAKGGPNGGDGGRGGDVILCATANVDTLLDLTSRHHYLGGDGQVGAGKQRHGRNGDPCVVKVPPGTMIFDDESGELIADLDSVEKQIIVAKGGRGGFGNEHFKSPTNQTPRKATLGEPAQERRLRLELKLIADIGLVGLPNAGKSTLLSMVSAARPKIAAYPFTTLEPNLGIVELSGSRNDPRRLVVADIPGLIEGAHVGQGLGMRFLRHVERTRLLLHLLEVMPADGSDSVANYQTIRRELTQHSKHLAMTPELVVLTKMDMVGDGHERKVLVRRIEQELGKKVIAISAVAHQGTANLLEICWQQLHP